MKNLFTNLKVLFNYEKYSSDIFKDTRIEFSMAEMGYVLGIMAKSIDGYNILSEKKLPSYIMIDLYTNRINVREWSKVINDFILLSRDDGPARIKNFKTLSGLNIPDVEWFRNGIFIPKKEIKKWLSENNIKLNLTYKIPDEHINSFKKRFNKKIVSERLVEVWTNSIEIRFLCPHDISLVHVPFNIIANIKYNRNSIYRASFVKVNIPEFDNIERIEWSSEYGNKTKEINEWLKENDIKLKNFSIPKEHRPAFKLRFF